jgi:hypothetical protein
VRSAAFLVDAFFLAGFFFAALAVFFFCVKDVVLLVLVKLIHRINNVNGRYVTKRGKFPDVP